MKILITGITGLLGTELVKLLGEDHEVTGIAQKSSLPGCKVHNIDIGEEQKVYEIISRINPDIVIHAATMTNVDECEKQQDLAYRVNALGTRNIAVACQRFDTVLCYISTDYAFSGSQPPEAGYTEYDAIDPISVYAKSKVAGEQYVRNLLNKFFIVRTSWLFGPSRRNFVSQIAESLLAGKGIKAASDMISAPTHVGDLSYALSHLIQTRLYGTYHLTNYGFASRYDIAARIAAFTQTDKRLIEKVKLDDLKLPARRPHFSGLRNYVWSLEGFKPLRPWQDAVKDFLANQKYI